MGRYAHLERCWGAECVAAVHSSRVLCVGAGGIGCELLKNLVLAGFRRIEVVDLDTIDVSNLNRQFLFRSQHVGKSKAAVAREAALAFNPDAEITAHHGNIKAEEFGLNFFKQFDLVLNALDNVAARQHVNRLCLAADIPLVDSGTTGYLGQTAVIKKGETACYDCEPKSDNKKSFPICTIRNTPDKPVHCIVWAKELFKLLFGNKDESMLSGSDEGVDAPGGGAEGEAAADTEELSAKEREVRAVILGAAARPDPAAADEEAALREYARGIFAAVFDAEIQLKLKMRDGYKGAKKKPTPLTLAQAMADTETTGAATHALKDQRVLSLAECADLFVASVLAMWAPDKRAAIGLAEFDKDDALALDFVTAAANLRCHVFGIERKSKFDVKGIAGNIIHAIATTNAIVAGLQVIESIKLIARLKRKPLPAASLKMLPATAEPKVTDLARAVWVVREPIGSGFLLQASATPVANPKCYSCGNAVLTLSIDTQRSTLALLVVRGLVFPAFSCFLAFSHRSHSVPSFPLSLLSMVVCPSLPLSLSLRSPRPTPRRSKCSRAASASTRP